MLKILSYKYRIYPNNIQKSAIDANFSSCRNIYNLLLSNKVSIYKFYKDYEKVCKELNIQIDKLIFNRMFSNLTIPMLKERYPYLKKSDSLALCSEWNNIRKAFINFYNNRCKVPKYKSRKDKNTYITSNVYNNIRIENNKIRLPKIGFVKVKLHRSLPQNYKIKRVIVSNDKVGKYFVNIVVEFDYIIKEKIALNNIVGLDFKIGDIFVSSNNERPKYLMPYRNALIKLKKLEKALIRCRKFSKNWWKRLRKIQRLHKKISFKRRDFLHKTSTNVSEKYDIVAIETLSITDISKKLTNGINTYDTSYYKFTQLLKYKLFYKDKLLVYIDKWYPSSKMCSRCGYIKSSLFLSDRVYLCENCDLEIDRDLNAAINIAKEGLRIIS